MKMSSFDQWLTTEPSWRREPLHVTESVTDDELDCAGCEDPVGQVGDTFFTYWQIDEDGEHLLCEPCYKNEPSELDECVECGAGAWINTKGRCTNCEEKA